MTLIERYRVEKNGLGWCVYCGNGTRILFRSVMEHTCQCVASELRTAFADGEFVAERQAADLLEAKDARIADPETIKQLVELVRLQNAALEFASDFIPRSACSTGDCEVCQALEAFNKWEKT